MADEPATSLPAANSTNSEARVSAGKPRVSPLRAGAVAIAVFVAIGVALGGYMTWRLSEYHETEQRRAMFLDGGRKAATVLTTIDSRNLDADIQRIVDASTGAFLSDFQARKGAFSSIVQRIGAVSTGTIAQAGLESEDGNQAQVLVAVSVKTQQPASKDAVPKLWRMRITVDQVGENSTKFSGVELVP